MRHMIWGITVVVGLAAVVMVGIWLWPRRESAELREVKQMQAEMQKTMFAPPEEAKDIPPEERRAKFEALREKMEALPEADRKQAEKAMFQGMHKHMEQKLATFFALPPEEQTAALDKDIDEQEARRKAFGGGPFGPPPVGGPPPGGGTPASGGSPSGAPGRVAGGAGGSPPQAPPGSNGAPGASGNNGAGRGGNHSYGPPRNFQNMSAEERKERQRDMLNSTTPESRAQMTEYIKRMRARRQERGLPSFGPPG